MPNVPSRVAVVLALLAAAPASAAGCRVRGAFDPRFPHARPPCATVVSPRFFPRRPVFAPAPSAVVGGPLNVAWTSPPSVAYAPRR